MCPRSEPSPSRVAQPRPPARPPSSSPSPVNSPRPPPPRGPPATPARPVSVVIAVPGELDARALPRRHRSTIHVSLDGDEPEVAGPGPAQLDDTWLPGGGV